MGGAKGVDEWRIFAYGMCVLCSFFSIVQTYITLTLDSTIFYLVNIKLSSLIVIPLTIDIVICIAIICVNNHIVHQEVHSSLSLRSVFIGNPVITVESFSFLLFFFIIFFFGAS